MVTGTMVTGITDKTVNVRTSPEVAVNFHHYVGSGTAFEGSLVPCANATDTRLWIKLTKLAGVVVTGLYIAAYVVTYNPVPVPADPPSVPESFILTDPASGVSTEYAFVRIVG